jgi:hypothetical protein
MTFYFAWIDKTEAFDADVHSREDESVFAFDMIHAEGGFAMLAIDIRNPRTSLLGPSRKQWFFLSQNGTALFKGRLVAVPEDLHKEIVRLNFIARPEDYPDQKIAVATALKFLPFFDPVWIDEQRLDDPDVVLESRAELWHIDRLTHAVTTSAINIGEDAGSVNVDDTGASTFTHFYDSLKISYGAIPLRKVQVNATVTWNQKATGSLDFTKTILGGFGGGLVSSYTGQGLQSDWPKTGADMHGGWSTGPLILKRVDGVTRPSRHTDVTIYNNADGDALSVPVIAQFYVWEFRIQFPISYDVSRARIETLAFATVARVQPLVTEALGADEETIVVSSKAVGEISKNPTASALDQGKPPIGDLRLRSYFLTIRGERSFAYLQLLARAKLLASARAVSLTIRAPFAEGVMLSCRQNGRIVDPRLPGGFANGKITQYRLVANGDGSQYCEVVLGATIGMGEDAPAPAPGTPDYVDEGYVEADYQTYTGQQKLLVTEDTIHEALGNSEINDDGIDFLALNDADQVVTNIEVLNNESQQAGVISHPFSEINAAIEALNHNFTEIILELKPLTGGPFETPFNYGESVVYVPKTMEL